VCAKQEEERRRVSTSGHLQRGGFRTAEDILNLESIDGWLAEYLNQPVPVHKQWHRTGLHERDVVPSETLFGEVSSSAGPLTGSGAAGSLKHSVAAQVMIGSQCEAGRHRSYGVANAISAITGSSDDSPLRRFQLPASSKRRATRPEQAVALRSRSCPQEHDIASGD